jgi:hypothetical protein
VNAGRGAVGGQVGSSQPEAVSARLSAAILRGDRARARQIYYDELLPDRGFSDGEVARLSYRLGVVDEGDRYLAEAEPPAGGPV